MKKISLSLVLIVALASLAALAGSPALAAGGGNAPVYFVALGDSLAAGAQPAPSGVENRLLAANGTNRGYVDVLHATMRDRIPNLLLRDFSCSGETTTSLIQGGLPFDVRCGYGQSSQLAEALSFLRAHPGEIAFVTIDIGANDLRSGNGGLPAIAANLPQILAAVRAAVGPGVSIVGMSYYDPFLAPIWFGTQDLGALQAEVAAIVWFNDFLEGIYAASGVLVADVETAFQVTDITPVGGVPVNVARACQWTWICAVGDTHPNDAGHAVIARAFQEVLQP